MDLIARKYKAMQLNEATEDDVNRVAKAHSDIPKETIQGYSEHADPKPGKGSRYLDWIVKQHKMGNHALEDAPRIKEALTGFEANKHKIPNKDIGSYKHISEVENAVHAASGQMSKTQLNDPNNFESNPAHREKIFDNGKGLQVFHTKTKEASQAIYGGGHNAGGCHTSWCTAAKSEHNRFAYYSQDGKNPLYQIHTPDGKVYQDEFSGDYSGGLRSADDRSVERDHLVSQNPDLAKVPAFQGKDISYTSGPKIHEALENHLADNPSHYMRALNHPSANESTVTAALKHIPVYYGGRTTKENSFEGRMENIQKHHAFNPDVHLHGLIKAYASQGNATPENILNHPAITAEHIHTAIDNTNGNPFDATAIVNHPKFNESHAQKIISNVEDQNKMHKNFALGQKLVTKKGASPAHATQLANSTSWTNYSSAIESGNVPDEELKKIADNPSIKSRSDLAIQHMKSPEMIHSFAGSNPSEVAKNPRASKETIASIAASKKDDNLSDLIGHKNVSGDTLMRHIKARPNDFKNSLESPAVTSDHIKQIFEGATNHLGKQAAIRHPKAPTSLIDDNMHDVAMHGSISVSKAATPEHLDMISSSPHQFIRENVASNKNTSKETLTKLRSDPDTNVSVAATKSLSKRK